MKKHVLLAVCAVAGVLPWSQSAQAQQVLGATYFSVPNGGAGTPDPDFQRDPFTTPIIAIGSGLGPNGMPIATGGVSDIGPGSQLTWWSPTLNNNVTQTGTGFITLPYLNNAMFPPNNTGASDASAFETAIFKGDINLTGAASALTAVSFHLTSDDDSLIYVDGKYIGGLPGVHATESTTITDLLSASDHSLEIFYADRHTVGAVFGLSISPDSIMVSPGPTPGVGLLGLGFLVLAGAMTRMRGLLAR